MLQAQYDTERLEREAAIQTFLHDAGLDLSIIFVPWKFSRNYKPDWKPGDSRTDLNFNYRVNIVRTDKDGTLYYGPFDYSMGVGHSLTGEPRPNLTYHRNLQYKAILKETETGEYGRESTEFAAEVKSRKLSEHIKEHGRAIRPDHLDVWYCLVMDAMTAINCTTFSDFCLEFDYDDNSIKDKTLYESMQDNYNQLSKAITRAELETLSELFQDY